MRGAVIARVIVLASCIAACHASEGQRAVDAALGGDAGADAASDGGTTTPLALTCSATQMTYTPNPCPASTDGKASFCFRAQWHGVTGVDVYGDFGQATPWAAPFTTLADDGTGTFAGTATVAAGGPYPYLFRVHGGDDNLVRDGTYLLDQNNDQFEASPAGAPNKSRSVSTITIPQPAAPALNHITGSVVYAGVAQPCFSVSVEVGEQSGSERAAANFVELGADGHYDFPVADGMADQVVVRFPFLLAGASAAYPDPMTTPSIGFSRALTDVAGADVALDPADIAYSEADYAAMSPTNGSGALPQMFTWTMVAGAQSTALAVIDTNIAGNDPAYETTYGTMTSTTWDGTFNNQTKVVGGTTYWWGAWQRRTPVTTQWTQESLLFPITF